MNNSMFFKQNAEPISDGKFVVSKRFKDAGNNPIEWIFRSIPSELCEEIRRNCTKRVLNKNIYTYMVDNDKFVRKLAAACTVFPDLKNSELQNSYGVVSDDALLKAMLIPGEYFNYVAEIQKIMGFEIDQTDAIDEIKNS
jgi:hypothetical protein